MSGGFIVGKSPKYAADGGLKTDFQRTAFGEQLIAEPTPVTQVSFPYNLNTQIMTSRLNSGSASVANNLLTVSTGASANRLAMVLTKKAIKLNSGQGGLFRGNAIFTTGVANSTQTFGVGDPNDGYFFGYNGAAFGVLHRRGGKHEFRLLTVTTGSSHGENITITLDGDAVTDVTVTNTADKTLTANEIAAHDYSAVGDGWRAEAQGDEVEFVSYTSGSKSGTYTLSSATSAVGTFGQDLAGVASTDTWIAQTAWNKDAMDGDGPSGMTLDPTKGNDYEIRYQGGFGSFRYYLENPETDEFVLVHHVHYANNNILPSVDNPTLPLCAGVVNASNTSDIVIKASDMAGFVEGRHVDHGLVRFGTNGEVTSLSTTEIPVLTLHNELLHASIENRVRIRIDYIGIASSLGSKSVVVRFKTGTTLTGASFAAINATNSVVSKDTTATAVTGGTELFSVPLDSEDREFIDLTGIDFEIAPGEFFTVTAIQVASGGTSTLDVDVNWEELY